MFAWNLLTSNRNTNRYYRYVQLVKCNCKSLSARWCLQEWWLQEMSLVINGIKFGDYKKCEDVIEMVKSIGLCTHIEW